VTDELATVLDLVRYATSRFAAAGLVFGHGTAEPFDEAVFLVGEALELPTERMDLFYPARLTAPERTLVLGLIEERIASRKPAPYLVNRAYMHGLPFYVDERAIVPRSYLGEVLGSDMMAGEEHALLPEAPARVLDLCTGSGCLAVLAALRFPEAAVDAVDLSPDALEVARINVADYGLEERVSLFAGDLYSLLPPRARYDLILSNPPYVDAEAMAGLPPEYRHEPAMALAAGEDGLAIVARIIEGASRRLSPGGGLLCEIGRVRPALEDRFPELPFLWLDTEASSGEVFWLPAEALR